MIGVATIVVDEDCDNCGWSYNNCGFCDSCGCCCHICGWVRQLRSLQQLWSHEWWIKLFPILRWYVCSLSPMNKNMICQYLQSYGCFFNHSSIKSRSLFLIETRVQGSVWLVEKTVSWVYAYELKKFWFQASHLYISGTRSVPTLTLEVCWWKSHWSLFS